jgi:uncharacterized CHY-type Zn-finger protein
MEAPNNASTWEDELWRLERLYCQDGTLKVEEKDTGQHILHLVHHCTDPDWEAVNWAPEGLLLEISVPSSYPELPAERPSLKVRGPGNLQEKFVNVVAALFEHSVSTAPPRSPAIYRALQAVDKVLAEVWLKIRAAAETAELAEAARVAAAELEEARARAQEQAHNADVLAAKKELRPKPRRPATIPWTSEEQSLLEEALAEFQGEADVKQRWKLIARHVGGERTARDCADRFRACREFALGKIDNPDAIEENPHCSEEEPPATPAPQAVIGWSVEDVRRMGVEIRLVGLNLEGFTHIVPSILRIQVVCDRCKKPMDVANDESISGTEPCTIEDKCPVCKQEIALRIAPGICHGGCPTVAHVLGVSCHPVQLHRSDFAAYCGECTEVARVRNVGPGYRKRAECSSCFMKMNLTVEGADLLGQAVARWQQLAEDEGERLTARKQLQDARRQEKEIGIKVGQPLPEKGTCKHYGKSYRWLRFPCCGRAFACDICHDEQTDHIHDWANRMLCGLCSHEQPFSKDKCTYCGAAQTRSRSAFWEGGDGCRNRTTMSKSDPHKYKGLSKTASVKK